MAGVTESSITEGLEPVVVQLRDCLSTWPLDCFVLSLVTYCTYCFRLHYFLWSKHFVLYSRGLPVGVHHGIRSTCTSFQILLRYGVSCMQMVLCWLFFSGSCWGRKWHCGAWAGVESVIKGLSHSKLICGSARQGASVRSGRLLLPLPQA